MASGLAEKLLTEFEEADEPASRPPEATGRFGGKGFGLLASIALTTNNISGAGMLEFPQACWSSLSTTDVARITDPSLLEFAQMFQRAGLLPSLLSMGLVCVISTLFATTLADTVARIPNNRDFTRRIEFSCIFEYYIGRCAAMFTQAVVFLNLLAQNLASIVACAQMFDSFAGVFWPGATIALRVSPSPVEWVRWEPSQCRDDAALECVPFASEGEDALLISAGYVTTALLLAPLGLLTLEENMAQQNISFAALLLLSAQFLFAFCATGLRAGTLPWIGRHWIDAVGVVMRVMAVRTHPASGPPLTSVVCHLCLRSFNFAFCVTVPSWLNEKAPHVGVNRVFWTSTILSTLLYTSVGVLGAMAFAQCPENAHPLWALQPLTSRWAPKSAAHARPGSKSEQMLSIIVSERVGLFTRLCGTIFGVVIIGFGVPIFVVIMRYNLVNGGLCSERWAHVWSSVLPWGTAWMLYQGSVTLKLLAYSGIVLNGFTDFVTPGVVTLVSLGAARRVARYCRWSADSPPLRRGSSTPVQPFPAALSPFYVEIVAGMVAFLLVLLPVAVWLQVYCGYSPDCKSLAS